MDDCAIVTLPSGLWLDGRCYRDAQLRPLNGADEAFLIFAGETLLPAQRATTMLARALNKLGPLEPVTTEAVRQLTAGDREALLLHLRALTLGERMQCVLTCPDAACAERIECEIQANELLLPAYQEQHREHQLTLGKNGSAYSVTVRLPNGGDLEAAAPFALTDPEAAAAFLLSRCIEKITLAGSEESVTELPVELDEQVAAALALLDPQSELILDLTCPACDRDFSALVDVGGFFYQEVRNHLKSLYLETHLLAFHYHWSEAEIMSMSATKRRRYLELLQDELDRESRA